MENFTNSILSFFSESTDINWFFNTIATTSTVFIVVTTTIVIYRVTLINEIFNKKSELSRYELEVDNLKVENEKLKKILNTNLNGDEYRRYAELVTLNYARIFNNEQRIDDHTKFIEHYEKIKTYLNKLIKNLYIFLIIYIIFPLSLLSLPNNEQILIGLNIIKILLLVTLLLYLYNIIKGIPT